MDYIILLKYLFKKNKNVNIQLYICIFIFLFYNKNEVNLMNNIYEKRSVKSYLLSIFLVLIYIASTIYAIWEQEKSIFLYISIVLNGILTYFAVKRSILASFFLVIFHGYIISFPTTFIEFINGNVNPFDFFFTCLIMLFYFSIFIESIIEKGYEAKNKPKTSFYYTEKDYTPRNKK